MSKVRLFTVISIICIAVAILTLIVSAVGAILNEEKPKPDAENETYMGIRDIYLPSGLNNTGLYWFDGEDFVKSNTAKGVSAFNLQKPTMIFIHGTQNTTFLYSDLWFEAGYNVGIFNWSQFVNESDKNYLSKKFNDKNYMRWTKLDGAKEETDLPNASLTQIFLAYYLDFMAQSDYVGNEIRFVGEAEGAEFVANILKDFDEMLNKSISKDFLPDRAALINPQFVDKDINVKANEFAIKLGIATEIMQFLTQDSDYELCKYAQYVNYGQEINPLLWYSESLNKEIPVDHSMLNSTEYSFSAKTPLNYVLARRGIKYLMHDENYIISTNLQDSLIAGFAFLDEDKNGKYNERIKSRLKGAKIELYLSSGLEDRLLDSCFSDSDGFYSLVVPMIYANSFDKLFIKAYQPLGYDLTKRASYNMMANDINYNNSSDLFTMQHRKSIMLVNIGVM